MKSITPSPSSAAASASPSATRRTLHEHIRLQRLEQRLRCVLFEADHPVHRSQTGEHPQAAGQRVDGTALALQALHRSVVVHCDHKPVANGTGFIEVGHMAGVENVEAAVGEHHAFTRLARPGHRLDELLARYDAFVA